ncbi:hypothetical protein SARC_00129 [Sphaeroforma arctica JP610]|uniref:Uncharacterized protein n=1 Tax=Sphaeroforma arctica JP610 TaxID=667725 RepID=A0A0L0GFF1_9EUKA|nr:hypothetical protein SARC_00129 [Sphaeroforma arctica JP610]KNC87757.1 hypothetical protein SARC_00129 [Sphaeroforma arctica JP610]|eukprot:XP_014161659.1 hypothetical protein SARC_00129 [Sphaeroforma arctica JP610]
MALAPALEIYISKPSHGIKEAVVCNLLRMAEKWPDELGEEIAEILAAGLNVELPDTPNVLLEVLPKVYDVLPRAIETNLSGLVAPYKLLGTPRHLDHTILNILVTVATNKACLVLPYIGVVLDSIVIAQKGPKNKDLIFALFRKILFDDPIFVMQSMPDLNILAGNDEKYLAAVQGLRNYLGLNDHDGSTTSLDEP